MPCSGCNCDYIFKDDSCELAIQYQKKVAPGLFELKCMKKSKKAARHTYHGKHMRSGVSCLGFKASSLTFFISSNTEYLTNLSTIL